MKIGIYRQQKVYYKYCYVTISYIFATDHMFNLAEVSWMQFWNRLLLMKYVMIWVSLHKGYQFAVFHTLLSPNLHYEMRRNFNKSFSFHSTALVTGKEWHTTHCASDKPRQDFSLVKPCAVGSPLWKYSSKQSDWSGALQWMHTPSHFAFRQRHYCIIKHIWSSCICG